jgi:Holliday junction DNA helicase RuvB
MFGRRQQRYGSFEELTDQIALACGLDQPEEEVAAAAEVPAHRPASWDDYIGQHRVRRRLEIAVASAVARDARCEHILLVSGPGAGKTTLGNLIASELGRPLVLLTKPPKSAQLLEACRRAANGVLFVDEVHCWNAAMQHELMELTESGTLDTAFGPQRFPKLTVIAATTEEDKLGVPLIDRFGCYVKLDPYDVDEMAAIGAGMVERCWPTGTTLDAKSLRILATAAAGVPRNLRSLVFAGRDLALAGVEVTVADILLLTDTDPDGCTRAHLDLLDKLDSFPKGTAGLSTLASMMRVPADMLRRTEQLLVDRGYVALTPNGRQITPRGRARLAAGSIRDAA